jgi:pentatricopeptide repeat protein
MTSYVCRQCRTRLTQQLRPTRLPQWQSRATFISLRNSDQPERNPSEAPQHDSDSVDLGNKIRKVGIGERPTRPARQQAPGIGRYSRYAQTNEQQLDLEEAVPEADEQLPQRRTLDEQFRQRRGTPRGSLWNIEQSLRNRNLGEAWQQFETAYPSKDCQALVDPPIQEVKLLTGGTVFKKLLDNINAEFCKGKQVPVTPAEALLRYHQLDLFRFAQFNIDRASGNWISNAWRDTTRNLVYRVIPSAPADNTDPAIILEELSKVLRLFFQVHSAQSQSVDFIDADWRTLPDTNDMKGILQEAGVDRDITNRLALFHPKISGNATISFAAVLLFQTLNGKNSAIDPPQHLKQQNEPFVRFMASLLALGSIASIRRSLEVSTDFKALGDVPQHLTYDMIKAASIHAMNLIGAVGSDKEIAAHASEVALDMEQFFLKRISRAAQDIAHATRLERLWQEAIVTYTQKDGKIGIPLNVYNAFLTGFLGLLAPDQSVKVWNHMIANGVTPTVSTWTAMMSGCQKAKDVDGLQAMWHRMVRSGVQPDVYAWTSRIHGLISLREIDLGLAAMDEMGRQWLSQGEPAQSIPKVGKGKPQPTKVGKGNTKSTQVVTNFPKPSIEVINGAMSAIVSIRTLASRRKTQYIQQILQWAGQFSIKPNAITYNVLIQHYLTTQDLSTAYKLLGQMDAEGVEADAATYTMLIRAAFSNQSQFDGLSPADQTDRILTLFRELEAGGVKLNAYLYSSVVHSFLKQYENFDAVRVVIDHMMSRKLNVTTQIYTSLMTYYFEQEPPNIPAVDSLWHQILSTPGTPTDNILFDRVIEGYAAVGEIGKMMASLTRMSAHGKLPGWNALSEVVRALAEAGDWERAASVVRDVQAGEGVARGITGGAHGMRDFTSLVARLGLGNVPMGGHASGGLANGQQVMGGRRGLMNVQEEFAGQNGVEQIESTVRDKINQRPQEVGNGEQGHEPRAEHNGSVGGIPL